MDNPTQPRPETEEAPYWHDRYNKLLDQISARLGDKELVLELDAVVGRRMVFAEDGATKTERLDCLEDLLEALRIRLERIEAS